MMDGFKTVDLNGVPFHVEFDGAEGIGFWVGDPEEPTALGLKATYDLAEWFLENFELRGEI